MTPPKSFSHDLWVSMFKVQEREGTEAVYAK